MDYFFNNSVLIERQNTGTALFNRLGKTALAYTVVSLVSDCSEAETRMIYSAIKFAKDILRVEEK